MSEATTAVDELDTTLVTEFVYNETNSEKKSWKFCNNVTLPRSEVVFVAQMVVIQILLLFCILKLSFTKKLAKKRQFGSQFYQAWLVTYYQIQEYE